MKTLKLITVLFVAFTIVSCSKTTNPTPSASNPTTPAVSGKFYVSSQTFYNGSSSNTYNVSGLVVSNNTNINAGNVYFNNTPVVYSTVGNSYNNYYNTQNYTGAVTWKFDGDAANSVSAFTFAAKDVPYIGINADTIHVNGNGNYVYNGSLSADSISLVLSNTFNAKKTYSRTTTCGTVTFTQSDVNTILNDPSNGGIRPTYLYLTITAKNTVNYTIGGRTYQFISEQVAQQNIQVRN